MAPSGAEPLERRCCTGWADAVSERADTLSRVRERSLLGGSYLYYGNAAAAREAMGDYG
jgi:hypothetical protein